jgi:hypothetical protein
MHDRVKVSLAQKGTKVSMMLDFEHFKYLGKFLVRDAEDKVFADNHTASIDGE